VLFAADVGVPVARFFREPSGRCSVPQHVSAPFAPSAPSAVSSAPSGLSRPSGSSSPTAGDLLDFVRRTAADTELIDSLPLDPEGRTWVRLDGPGGSEAWLIGWPPGAGTG
jgi:hypothetical protein